MAQLVPRGIEPVADPPLSAPLAERGESSPEAGGRLPWTQLFDGFFSENLADAAQAASVFARTIRFWLVRLGVRQTELAFEDLVQDVLLELTRSRGCIKDPSALGSWLRTTAIHKVNDRWRSSQRRGPAVSTDALELSAGSGLLPDEHVLRKQDRAELLQAVVALPPLLRDCVRLYLQGLSEAQLVSALRERFPAAEPIEKHTVKNWLRRARQLLRAQLAGEQRHA